MTVDEIEIRIRQIDDELATLDRASPTNLAAGPRGAATEAFHVATGGAYAPSSEVLTATIKAYEDALAPFRDGYKRALRNERKLLLFRSPTRELLRQRGINVDA